MTTTDEVTRMSAAQLSSLELVGELVRRGQAEDVGARAGFDGIEAMVRWAVEDDQDRR
ncbi:hypothetical protein [Mycolicibacterium farcinogenes]|uniref:Uncharacterized protein n=1 Tax=Mycolicibacterium farcinogenes TaxID=1802 RepID=A0ACD1F9U0_MYCFR|nr:hypothetical protein [Mycolicibacterium farcinogenes]QZH63818.1 hypothetical protein K6L26_17200 [Mycolicibacterium farcinogenes]